MVTIISLAGCIKGGVNGSLPQAESPSPLMTDTTSGVDSGDNNTHDGMANDQVDTGDHAHNMAGDAPPPGGGDGGPAAPTTWAIDTMLVERPSGAAGFPALHNYTSNDQGQLTREIVTIGDGGSGGQFVTTITYNPDSTARLETTDPAGATVRRENWTLDDRGRRSRRVLVNAAGVSIEDLTFSFLGETDNPTLITGSWDTDGDGSLETRLRFAFSYNLTSGRLEKIGVRQEDRTRFISTSLLSYDAAGCIDTLVTSIRTVVAINNDYTCTVSDGRLTAQSIANILMPGMPHHLLTIAYDPTSGNISDVWDRLPDGSLMEHRHYTWTAAPPASRPTILDPLRGVWEGTVWQLAWPSLSPLP